MWVQKKLQSSSTRFIQFKNQMFYTSMFLPRSKADLPVAAEQFCNFRRRLEISSSLFWKCIFWVKTKYDVSPFSMSSVFLNSNSVFVFFFFLTAIYLRDRGKKASNFIAFFCFPCTVLEFSFCTIYGACSPIQILQSYSFFRSSSMCHLKQ